MYNKIGDVHMNIRIKKLDDFGRGIAYINDLITFIPNALPEEVVEYEVTEQRKKYMTAKALRIFDESKERICPKCPLYLKCGGCDLEHMSFSYENKFKVEKVKNILNKFARTSVSDIDIVYGKDYFYRNKVTFVVRDGKIGLLEKNSNSFVEVDYCFLIDPILNEKIEMLKYLVSKEKKIDKIMLRVGNITKEVMIYSEGEVENKEGFRMLCDCFTMNDDCEGYITSYILDRKFHIRSKSFFQVNNEIVEKMYQYIRECIKALSSKSVLDLYCGVGTIGITISDLVDKVIGVEVVKDAIVDARQNKELNNIQNISFINGRVEDVIYKIQNDIDTVILDPPRGGLDKKTLNTLTSSSIKNIIYITCNVSTFARDLLELKKKYMLSSIKLFNMFPRTNHVECVCVLNRR